MSQSQEIPICLHLIHQHLFVSDSPGGFANRITHPRRALCALSKFYVKWISTYSKYVLGWHIILVFSTHNNPHMHSSPRLGLLDNDASGGCIGEVTHLKRLCLQEVPKPQTVGWHWVFFMGDTMKYFLICINHINLICFHPFDGVCLSVIALEGAQMKRRTLERHGGMQV